MAAHPSVSQQNHSFETITIVIPVNGVMQDLQNNVYVLCTIRQIHNQAATHIFSLAWLSKIEHIFEYDGVR
jgi:hypothetical protein